jgi:acyl-CoA reductase-like NAD-dependent aldehyde dehydrogenase
MAELNSYDPSSGELVGSVPVTPIDEIAKVVSRAQAALVAWREISLENRATMLKLAADELSKNSALLGELLSREMGKPLARGKGEVSHCADWIHGKVAEMQQALAPEVLKDDGTETTLFFDPFGVAAVISPWNYPMSMPQWMVIPSLMAGNTVVLKPSEETPLIAQAYVECLNKYLPENVLQIIYGADDQV